MNHVTQGLGDRAKNDGVTPERVAAALLQVGETWSSRLAHGSGWTPPAGSPYPWAQVKISLAGLIPSFGLRSPLPLAPSEGRGETVEGIASIPPLLSEGEGARGRGRVAALILAGNTPLMAWSPMCACLLAGWSVVVKMSRDETLWPRLFVESLAEVNAEVAARVHLEVWPGEDERTAELCRAADAVIAYGSDATIDALRAVTPPETPFFGYGHSVSVGLVIPTSGADYGGFARDMLLCGQAGCLSLTAVFVRQDAHSLGAVCRVVDSKCKETAERLEVSPVSDPAVARIVRQARDMALFAGATVWGDEKMRWTLIQYNQPRPMDIPSGHGIVQMIPIADVARDFGAALGPLRGRISCVGVAGELTGQDRAAILEEGVSRICASGEMQAPPLDWPNGNRDLLAELLAQEG